MGKIGANLAIMLLDELLFTLWHDAAGLSVCLSLKKLIRPAPPEPSVCVTPIYNVYKLDST